MAGKGIGQYLDTMDVSAVLHAVVRHPAVSAAALLALYTTCVYIYRLTLHPLAGFPGPRLAAMTLWYEFYHDFFRHGKYIFVIRDMHEKYGPIVRVTPDELHVNDPSFLPELMPTAGKRRHKFARLMQIFGFAEAAGATVDHDAHRIRRSAMSKMFSKEAVRRLEPIMKDNMEKLFSRMDDACEKRRPINLLAMYGAFTNDLITQYAYGFNSHWLEGPGFNQGFFDMISGFHDMGPLALQFSWFMPMFTSLPQSLILKINPGMSTFVKFKEELLGNIQRVKNAREQGGKDQKTVFDEIYDSKLSDYEKRPSRLLEEAQNISIAGTETTSWTLSVLFFHLLSTPRVLAKLRNELRTKFPDAWITPSLKEVEQLPYLSAVISEGLRLAMGTSNRQTRVSPDEVLVFNDGTKNWEIPKGAAVGMATPLVHLNPKVFADPLTFSPERWIENPGLKRSLMSFSQGSRQCLGIQLAYAEMYLLIAGILRRYGGPQDRGPNGWLELYQTDKTDVEMIADGFVPLPKRDSKGVRVLVRR